MRVSRFARLVSAAVAVGAGSIALVGAQAASAASGRTVLRSTVSRAAVATPRVASVAAGSSVDFEVDLRLRDAAGAKALATAVSTPGSAMYRKFLTPAQWEGRFAPTAGQVAEIERFLAGSGLRVTGVSRDRMAVYASGSAARIERAFRTSLSYHRVAGRVLRLADRALSVPSGLARLVVGINGVTQTVAIPASYPPPGGFRAAHPCSAYYGQLLSNLPPFGNGYPANPPWAVCGYTPGQLRSGYNLTGSNDGSGITVAIVDAYAAPTLFEDAHRYASLNDPSHPLQSSQFSELVAPNENFDHLCGGNGWYGEQTLDVEAVHATAPGAHILFAGARNCLSGDLNRMIRTIVDGHLAQVITNSYGDPSGDLIDTPAIRASTDQLLEMAAGTGISVLFSSGDWFDNYTLTGVVAPTYPASSPWATGVGGTTVAIGEHGQRTNEWGWSTARSLLCTDTVVKQGGCTADQRGTWLPVDLGLDGGSGGGTSYTYPQPSYQAGVVPSSLSELRGSGPMRVEPDVSMEADPATGFLVGETQTFPTGVFYDQYRIGGTSLSSPLLAGVIARADQAAGGGLGLLNPAIYGMYGNSNDVRDILPAGKVDMQRADYANGITPGDGMLFWTRIVDYQGPEQFCKKAGDPGTCSRIDMTLHTAPGYDNMTGVGSPGNGFVSALASGK